MTKYFAIIIENIFINKIISDMKQVLQGKHASKIEQFLPSKNGNQKDTKNPRTKKPDNNRIILMTCIKTFVPNANKNSKDFLAMEGIKQILEFSHSVSSLKVKNDELEKNT
jgi:hypothetical protein